MTVSFCYVEKMAYAEGTVHQLPPPQRHSASSLAHRCTLLH